MSEQNVAAEGSANDGVRLESGNASTDQGTTISVAQATSGEHAVSHDTSQTQTGADAGAAQGTAPPPTDATGAAGQDQPAAKSPLRGPLAAASAAQTPSAEAATEAASWPDNWRETAAGGDADVAKRLERYSDPAALAKALVDTQNTLRAKGRIEPPGADATAEEKAQYAELTGVPLTPADYKRSEER